MPVGFSVPSPVPVQVSGPSTLSVNVTVPEVTGTRFESITVAVRVTPAPYVVLAEAVTVVVVESSADLPGDCVRTRSNGNASTRIALMPRPISVEKAETGTFPMITEEA